MISIGIKSALGDHESKLREVSYNLPPDLQYFMFSRGLRPAIKILLLVTQIFLELEAQIDLKKGCFSMSYL